MNQWKKKNAVLLSNFVTLAVLDEKFDKKVLIKTLFSENNFYGSQ